MRRAAALVTIPLLAAAAVAGCSSSSSSSSPAADTYKSVTVTGAFGKAPTVKIPAATGTGPLLTKTLIQGNGAKLTTTEGLMGNYVAYDWSGKTHKLIGSSFQTGKPQLFLGPFIPGLQKALIGEPLGSRVLAVVPPKDGLGANAAQAGIGASDTLVFVVDLDSSFSTVSVPGKQTSAGGGALPVVTPPAANSQAGPAIKIPAGTPPKTLQLPNLVTGTGPKVQKGQELVIQYVGMNWRTKKVFDGTYKGQPSYKNGSPSTVQIGAGQLIPAWDKGLVGKTVGSRVLMVIPPADGYGKNGNSAAGIQPTDTLVFVVDILAAVTP